MDLYYKGEKITAEAAIGIAENHGLTLEDAEYITECLQTGEPYDLREYKDIRDGAYVQCFVAFLGKVTPGPDAGFVTSQGGQSRVLDVEVVQDNEHIVSAAIQSGVNAMSGHFYLTDQGLWKIDEQNPPTIDDAYSALGHAMSMRGLAGSISNYAEWTLASLLYECEEYFGEDFSFSQIAKATEKNEVYCRKAYMAARWAANNWKPNLPATNLIELVNRKIDNDKVVKAVKIAEKLGLSQADCRKMAGRIIEGADPEELEGETRKETQKKIADQRHLWIGKLPRYVYMGYLPHGKGLLSDEWAVDITAGKAYWKSQEVQVKNLKDKKFVSTFDLDCESVEQEEN